MEIKLPHVDGIIPRTPVFFLSVRANGGGCFHIVRVNAVDAYGISYIYIYDAWAIVRPNRPSKRHESRKLGVTSAGFLVILFSSNVLFALVNKHLAL